MDKHEGNEQGSSDLLGSDLDWAANSLPTIDGTSRVIDHALGNEAQSSFISTTGAAEFSANMIDILPDDFFDDLNYEEFDLQNSSYFPTQPFTSDDFLLTPRTTFEHIQENQDQPIRQSLSIETSAGDERDTSRSTSSATLDGEHVPPGTEDIVTIPDHGADAAALAVPEHTDAIDHGITALTSGITPEPNQAGLAMIISEPAKNCRLPKPEWEKHKDKICRLYDTLALHKVRDRMIAEDRFDATLQMYKKRLHQWGKTKYAPRKGTQYGHEKATKNGTEISQRHGAQIDNAGYVLNGSRERSGLVKSPDFIPEGQQHLNGLWRCTDDLFVLGIRGEKWKLSSLFVIQEDEYDEFFLTQASVMSNASKPGFKLRNGDKNRMWNAVRFVADECGFFGLPVLWVTVARMLHARQYSTAKELLCHTGNLVQQSNAYGHQQFAEAIFHMVKLLKVGSANLLSAITTVYDRCIENVADEARSVNLTFLSLQSFYIVYLNNNSRKRIDRYLRDFDELLKASEDQNDHLDDITLDIMGNKIFLLQSIPDYSDELWNSTHTILRRITRRIQKGHELKGKLLEMWKDSKYTLATLYHKRGNEQMAVILLEEYFTKCDMENRDTWDAADNITYDKLQTWRKEVGVERQGFMSN